MIRRGTRHSRRRYAQGTLRQHLGPGVVQHGQAGRRLLVIDRKRATIDRVEMTGRQARLVLHPEALRAQPFDERRRDIAQALVVGPALGNLIASLGPARREK